MILTRIIIGYHVVVYLVYGTILTVCVLADRTVGKKTRADVPVNAGAWAAFHVVSSFNNVGFSLQRDGFVGFARYGTVLFAIGALVLHGNVLYPACLRWTVVALSATAPRHSNRKIYLRYLLLHGRYMTPCLFGSQQNWLLIVQQFGLFAVQTCLLVILSWDDDSMSPYPGYIKWRVAAFLAVLGAARGIVLASRRRRGPAPAVAAAPFPGGAALTFERRQRAPVPAAPPR